MCYLEGKKSGRFQIIEKVYDTYSVPEYGIDADTVFLPAKVQEKCQGFLCLATEQDQNVKVPTV
jgi:hypothetical protein